MKFFKLPFVFLSVGIATSALTQVSSVNMKPGNGQSTSSGKSSETTKVDTRPEAEARRILDRIWSQYLTKCGDSFYMLNQGESLVQLKDVEFLVRSDGGITRAEAMNGLQWRGGGSMRPSVSRQAVGHYTLELGTSIAQTQMLRWSAWDNGYSLASVNGIPFNVSLEKVNGKWLVKDPNIASWYDVDPSDPAWMLRPYPVRISCPLLPQ